MKEKEKRKMNDLNYDHGWYFQLVCSFVGLISILFIGGNSTFFIIALLFITLGWIGNRWIIEKVFERKLCYFNQKEKNE